MTLFLVRQNVTQVRRHRLWEWLGRVDSDRWEALSSIDTMSNLHKLRYQQPILRRFFQILHGCAFHASLSAFALAIRTFIGVKYGNPSSGSSAAGHVSHAKERLTWGDELVASGEMGEERWQRQACLRCSAGKLTRRSTDVDLEKPEIANSTGRGTSLSSTSCSLEVQELIWLL